MFVTLQSLINTLCRQVNDHVDIFVNWLIKFYLNDMVNLHLLTPHIMPKWRSYRDHGFCDVNAPYVPRRCQVTVLGKLFTPIVPLFTKQQNWQQPS